MVCVWGGGWPYKDLRREALFSLGVQLILETLKMIEDGKYSAMPQDESLASWEPPIEQIYNAWTELEPKTLALYAITLHVVQFLRVFFSQEIRVFLRRRPLSVQKRLPIAHAAENAPL